ncbi:MAG: hypothetical protein U5K43_00985 [Halofilum sp. (in: g-proteobacteria)]|nr:hypothetical protein [Halofilum sp. (in: g-proteobacteria)]
MAHRAAGHAAARIPGERILDWNGQQVWLRSPVAGRARARRGARRRRPRHRLFRGGDGTVPAFTPLPPTLYRLHERLKQALDPGRILNRGRMYPDL